MILRENFEESVPIVHLKIIREIKKISELSGPKYFENDEIILKFFNFYFF